MEARDIMPKKFTRLAPEFQIHRALEILLRHRIHAAPVVTLDGQFMGMISFSALARRVVEHITVRNVMSADRVAVPDDAPVDESGRDHAESCGAAWVPRSVGVKAAGGIRTYADAGALLHAGADLLGTSATEAILSDAAREAA